MPCTPLDSLCKIPANGACTNHKELNEALLLVDPFPQGYDSYFTIVWDTTTPQPDREVNFIYRPNGGTVYYPNQRLAVDDAIFTSVTVPFGSLNLVWYRVETPTEHGPWTQLTAIADIDWSGAAEVVQYLTQDVFMGDEIVLHG